MSFWSWLFDKNKKRRTKMDRVLLVGINQYPGCPLRGCVNDVNNVKNFLVSDYAFSTSDMKILTDREATTQNILNALQWFTEVGTGSRCYFHYSGHGAQAPINDPSEPDGLAEVICPIDFDWSPEHMVTDKQFVRIFSQIPQGCRFNWASDSCHSGDLDRKIPPPNQIPKRMLPPPNIAIKIEELKRKGVKSRALVGGVMEVGFVSGCRSDQTSADAVIGGQPCGAFTHFYLAALKSLKTAPLTDVGAATVKGLATNGYEQAPCVEGTRAGRAFLA